MKILHLNGEWQFREKGGNKWAKATVPGSNFTDLLNNGMIPDPFVGVNEKDKAVQEVALKDWEYGREFDIDDVFLKYESIELVCNSLDTLADVTLNGQRIISADNMFKRYTVDIKPYLMVGSNVLHAVFYSPIKYVNAEREKNKLMMSFDAIAPAQYIRKAQYHFGWDWGPQLPPSGISGDIYIKAFNKACLGDVSFRQTHSEDGVNLAIRADISEKTAGQSRYTVKLEIISPSGDTLIESADAVNGAASLSLNIKKPVLWWPNGLTDKETQPLYRINVYLHIGNTILDQKDYNIGLRTIELDTSSDSWGKRFAFKVNGRRIFAKGANWIPADSFTERVSYDKLDRLLKNMRDANMNMVRVWGGGFYESDDFYNICDKYGILVWQDCCFACQPYPLDKEEFVGRIEEEIYYNIGRIRHHAALALYCGNNELEQMAISWRFNKELKEATGRFFYRTLPDWIRQKDDVTPYWASSPSGGELLNGVNSESVGDTHLWRVWHGLSPYTYYRKVYTNFCSEFGMQSLPTMNTVKKFAQPEDYDLNSPVMKNHQKNMAGNSIMKYYLVADHRSPKHFEDLVYLTQVVQSECMREPTEHWRKNSGRCNGALYWQFNDCWPVSSWSSIDYYGNFKALHYAARRFNQPLTVIIENGGESGKDGMTLYVVNDGMKDFKGELLWRIESFDGEILAYGKYDVEAGGNVSQKLALLTFGKLLKTHGNDCVFVAELKENGVTVARKTALFKKEKKLDLPKSEITAGVKADGDAMRITLFSKRYARFVKLELDGITEPFSDNFFDMTANQEVSVTIAVPKNWDVETVLQRLTIKSIGDIEPGASELSDFLYKVKMNMKPMNIIKRIGYLLGI
ncbi:MAG: glycoside hydrolase family 2 protein [Clostridiales bacterium]|jgi:beta-mannosidase|nr:glycoside hydrolase family 2 protein [Clostridiales bacterium]